MSKDTSVVLAHHWLTGLRGGEKVLEQFCEIFPDAEISTLVAQGDDWPAWLKTHKVRTSILQQIPFVSKRFRGLLPFFPLVIRSSLKVKDEADLVLTSDASLIKGLRIPEDAIHVCYCHSPPRYLWDMQSTYLNQTSGLGIFSKLMIRWVTPYLRAFDLKAADRVDRFIANSKFVADRIRRCYGRDSEVIYPPVAFEDFRYQEEKEDFYLVVSELVPYKRIDLAIRAFNKSGKRLIVIGDGSERKQLSAMANDNITFLGRQPFSSLVDHYARCKAFIFPGVEDFGITPLEAQASGSPVVAYGRGGALETVVDGKTGVFFKQQNEKSLNEAIEKLDNTSTIRAELCRENALRFGPDRFRAEICNFLRTCRATERGFAKRMNRFSELELVR